MAKENTLRVACLKFEVQLLQETPKGEIIAIHPMPVEALFGAEAESALATPFLKKLLAAYRAKLIENKLLKEGNA